MARTLFVSITETTEELEKRLKANSTGSGKERLLMLYWLKRGEVKSRQELAKQLHRDEATITRWVSLYKKGGIKALQMDQGKIHQSSMLDWPENIVPIFQPAYSPELNPIERFWEHLKAQLKWHNCHCLDELRSSLKKALEEITPAAISSLTGWNFITNAVMGLV